MSVIIEHSPDRLPYKDRSQSSVVSQTNQAPLAEKPLMGQARPLVGQEGVSTPNQKLDKPAPRVAGESITISDFLGCPDTLLG